MCPEIIPEKSSDCLNHNITKDEQKFYSQPYDTCCYLSAKISGIENKECFPQIKNDVDEAELKAYYEEVNRVKFDDNGFSVKCESESDPGTDSVSIWLSLSLTFLFFGLLF